jgi:hypothetical protein
MYATAGVLDGTYTDTKKIKNNPEYSKMAKEIAENVFVTIKMVKNNPKLFWTYDSTIN